MTRYGKIPCEVLTGCPALLLLGAAGGGGAPPSPVASMAVILAVTAAAATAAAVGMVEGRAVRVPVSGGVTHCNKK